MKKVFFIDPQSYNNLAMYDYELLSRIEGYRIFFFGNKKYDYLIPENIVFKPIFSYSDKKGILKVVSYVVSLIYIFLCAIFSRPRLIHVQWIKIPRVDYRLYAFIRKWLSVKIVYTVHNVLPHVRQKNDKYLYGRFYAMSDSLIVHTQTSKNDLIDSFGIEPEKIHVISHGPLTFREDELIVKREVDRIREKYGIREKIVFGMLGNHSAYKGTDLLLDVWQCSQALSASTEACLIVAGKFHDIDYPSDLTKNIIVIPRSLTNTEFNALLQITDVLLLPYREISQSGLLLSAVTRRKPFCVSNIGELTKPLEIANVGWTFPSLERREIEELLAEIVDNPDSVISRRDNVEGWDMVCNYYSWDQSGSSTRALYDSISSN